MQIWELHTDNLVEILFVSTLSFFAGLAVRKDKNLQEYILVYFAWPIALVAFSLACFTSQAKGPVTAIGLGISFLAFVIAFVLHGRRKNR